MFNNFIANLPDFRDRILKIGEHLGKLQGKVVSWAFFDSQHRIS